MSRYERDVIVETNNPQADVLITDHNLRIVARGAAPLRTSLPPGIYGAKVTIGNEESSTMFSLGEGEGTTVVELASPVIQAPASLERDCSIVDLGVGSQIAFTVRAGAPGEDAGDLAAYRAVLSRFRLLDHAFKVVLEMAQCAYSQDGKGLMVCAALNPGAYILAHTRGGSMLCVSLPAVENMRLSCYLNLVTSPKGDEVAPDFCDMAISYGRLDDDTRDEEMLQAGEAIRRGMLEGKAHARTAWLRGLPERPFFDPMIGLYAGHLLLAEQNPDLGFLRVMIQKTAQMLGAGHPDIVALRIGYWRRIDGPERAAKLAALIAKLDKAPVLAKSWDLILATLSDSALPENHPSRVPVIKNVVSSGLYLTWLRSSKRSLKRALATVAKRAARSAAVSAMAGSGPIAALAAAAGRPMGVAGLLDGNGLVLRKMAGSFAAELARGLWSDDEVQSDLPDHVAMLMRELASKFPWKEIVRDVLRRPAVVAALQGLPLDLMVILRDAAGDEEMRAAVTGSFVREVVARTRTPLPVLSQTVNDVAQLAAAFMARERTPERI